MCLMKTVHSSQQHIEACIGHAIFCTQSLPQGYAVGTTKLICQSSVAHDPAQTANISQQTQHISFAASLHGSQSSRTHTALQLSSCRRHRAHLR